MKYILVKVQKYIKNKLFDKKVTLIALLRNTETLQDQVRQHSSMMIYFLIAG
jgi:hypothetical protein